MLIVDRAISLAQFSKFPQQFDRLPPLLHFRQLGFHALRIPDISCCSVIMTDSTHDLFDPVLSVVVPLLNEAEVIRQSYVDLRLETGKSSASHSRLSLSTMVRPTTRWPFFGKSL